MAPLFSRALVTAALLWTGAQVWAQAPVPEAAHFTLQTWETDDGLPHNVVNAVVKSSDGFIWLATFAGIARFDGTNFKSIPSPLVLTDKSRSVRCLIEENPSTLLLACDNTGVLQLQDGKISVDPVTARFPPGAVVEILFREQPDVFWIAFTNREIWRVDHGAIEKFPPPAVTSYRPTSFGRDVKGEIFVARGAGIESYQGRTLTPVRGAPSGELLLGSSRSGGAWAVTAGRIFRLEGDQTTLVTDTVPWPKANLPSVLKESRDGLLWVGLVGSGVWRWSPRGGTRVTAHTQITDIEEDDEGNLWFASAGGGLDRLQPTYFSLLATLDNNWLRRSASVCADTIGDVWCANIDGIHLIRGDREVPLVTTGKWPRGALPICADLSGHIWFAVNNRLCVAQAGQSDPPAWLPNAGSAPIRSLFAARDGSLWVGRTSGAMERYRGDRVESFGAKRGYAGTSFAQAIGEDAAGHIWVGTKDGELFELVDGRFRRYGREDGLPGGDVRAIYGDAQGTLWVGTHGGGLVIRQNGRFLRVTGAQGLPDEVISQLLEDDFGALWFGTARGLFRVYKQELLDCASGRLATITPITYDRADGLPGFTAVGSYQPTAWKTAAGRLWFVSRKGLVTTDPSQLRKDPSAPRTYLDRFAVDGRTVTGPKPQFSSAAQKYEFRFVSADFTAPQDVRYRYRLEGLEADWSEPIAARSVTYPKLSPGSYRFRVTSSNGNLVWNPLEASVDFTVRPAWWETLWARLGALGLAVTALTLLVRFVSHRRLRAWLERLELEQRVETERARIARDLHDGLGASLTQVSMMAEGMCEDSEDLAELKSQSARLADRVRTITRDLEGAVWNASPQHDTLSALCSYLSQFSLEYFAHTTVRCRVDVEREIPPLPISPEMRHHLFMIAKESMNNSLKHSHASRMDLTMRIRAETFELILADNGAGFDAEAAAATERNGLRNIRTRAAEAGVNLEVRSTAAGTVIRISFSVPAAVTPDATP